MSLRWHLVACGCLLGLVPPAPAGTPLDATFTYQGHLTQFGTPATGTYNMAFELYASANGTDLLDTYPDSGTLPVDVENGLFTVLVEFDASHFAGEKRWLRTIVDGSGQKPRQELTPVPYAIHSQTAGGLMLPFDGTAASDGPVFKVKNTGSGATAVFECGVGGGVGAMAFGPTGSPGGFFILNTTNPNGVLQAVTMGLGGAGLFDIENAASDSWALEVVTKGNGSAAHMHIDKDQSASPVLHAETVGLGPAGKFVVNNKLNSVGALYAQTNGSGDVFHAYTTGLGRAAYLEIHRPESLAYALDIKADTSSCAAHMLCTNVMNPHPALFVETDSAYNSTAYFRANTSSSNFYAVHAKHSGLGYAAFFEGQRGLKIQVNSSSNTALWCDGRIAVGQGVIIDPTEALDINGTARLRVMPSGSGTLVSVSTDGVLMRYTSSARYKENIRALHVDPDRVFQLNPVAFAWKQTGEPDVGLIAEDVERVLPELVVRDAQGRPDAVKYDKLGVYLLELVRTQQERIAAQEQRLTSLEREVAELKAVLRTRAAAVLDAQSAAAEVQP